MPHIAKRDFYYFKTSFKVHSPTRITGKKYKYFKENADMLFIQSF